MPPLTEADNLALVHSEHAVHLAQQNQGQVDIGTEATIGNENIARLRFTVRSGDYKGVAEIDFVYTGFARQMDDLGLLADRGNLDPFRLEARQGLGERGRDLRAALDAVLGGEAVAGAQKASIGCNIKWRPGNAPDYF